MPSVSWSVASTETAAIGSFPPPKEILALLEHELETGDLPAKAKIMFRLMGWLTFMLRRSTTTQHVDAQGW